MIVRKNKGKVPNFAATARAADNAVAVGDVTVGEGVSLWYGCVLRGDEGAIVIGDNTNIQDNCVLHEAVNIGQHVTVGHGAVVHGCTVGDNSLIGMGAILLNGCEIGEGSIVAAGALVPERAVIPPYSFAVGVPAKVIRTLTESEIEHNRRSSMLYVEKGAEALLLASENE